jgi:hypothetical protein
MTKLIIGLAALVLLAAGGALAGGSLADSSSSDVGVTTGTTTNDTSTAARTSTAPTQTREPGEDLRGPCDEAEHANDPRCAGMAPAQGAPNEDRADDHADSNRGHEVGGDDRSGSNRGSEDRGDDSGSGHGSDRSGHGSHDSGGDD